MKAIKWVVGILVLAVVVASVVLLSNINSLVKTAVEEVGSDVLGTPVTLSEVDIQLTEAKGVLRGLAIQNPKGFSNLKVLQVDEVLLDLDVKAIRDKLVAVQQVRVAGAKLVAEQKGTSTNLQALLARLQEGQGESSAAAESSSAAPDVRIKIDRFDFVDASARMISDQLGDTDLNLPDLRLTDVGGQQGLPPAELASALITPIITSLKQNMEGLLKSLAEKRIREEIKKQEEKAREKLKDKEDELKAKLEDKLDDQQKEQLKALKKLF